MAEQTGGKVQPGGDPSPGGQKVQIPVGVIAPCPMFKRCKVIAAEMAPVIYEWKGHVYFIGSVICPMCSRYERSDLFEEVGSKIVAEHPDAEQVVGVTSEQLASMSQMQPAPGKTKVTGR